MEIQNPSTAEFVPLLGAFNFEYLSFAARNLPDNIGFGIDWTKGGDGQEILREHIRLRSPMRVRQRGKEYQGVFKHESGFNTSNGKVFVEVGNA